MSYSSSIVLCQYCTNQLQVLIVSSQSANQLFRCNHCYRYWCYSCGNIYRKKTENDPDILSVRIGDQLAICSSVFCDRIPVPPCDTALLDPTKLGDISNIPPLKILTMENVTFLPPQ